MTTSAARTISSVHGFGCSPVMSMSTSCIARTAEGLISLPGSEPPDHATARPAARWLNQPRAIWDRPALCTQANNTVGIELTGSGDVGVVGEDDVDGRQVGVEVAGEADGQQATGELGDDEGGRGTWADAGEGVAEGAADGDCRVGEAGRRGEPVGRRDVAGHGERGRVGSPGAHDAEDHDDEPERGDDLAEPDGRAGADVGREVDR